MDLKEYFKIDVSSLSCHDYDAHIFGFTLDDLIRAIKMLVVEDVTLYTEQLIKAVLKKYTENDPEIDKVKELATVLINLYVCASVRPLEKLQHQLKDLLHIPPHVLLPRDEVQKNQYSAQDEAEVDKRIEDLFKRIKRTKSFDVELLQERQLLRDMLPQLKRRIGELGQMDPCTDEGITSQVLSIVDTMDQDMQKINCGIQQMDVNVQNLNENCLDQH